MKESRPRFTNIASCITTLLLWLCVIVLADDNNVQELYISQTLDHFDATNEATFAQRYFVSYRHSSNSGLPILSLLCVGGEGPGFDKSVLIDSVHCTGDMLELAQKIAQAKTHDVILYALEHRYYGKSYPKFIGPDGNQTSPLTTENLRFLSSRQALEDLAHFVHSKNQELGESTWVTFGGSYPGLMSMYARYKYPHLVFASVSSSAPLQLTVDFPGYKDRQGWDLKYDKIGGSNECHRIVKVGHEQAVGLLQQEHKNGTEDGSVTLAKSFHLCNPEKILEKRRNQELLLGDGLINIMSQGNDPSCSGDDLCNIAGLCRFMTTQMEQLTVEYWNGGDDDDDKNLELQVLAKVAQKQYAQMRHVDSTNHRQQLKLNRPKLLDSPQLYDDDNCLNIEYNDMIQEMSSEVVEPFGMRSWIWQTCTEFGFYQTCGDNCPFASHFHSIDMDLEICSLLFNISSTDVYDNVQSSLDQYGGKDFLTSGASNILTVNGNVDPWSVLGLEESDSTSYKLPVKMVPGASHHFWTHPVKDTDAVEIVQIREYIHSTVMTWLGMEAIDVELSSVRHLRG